MEANSKRDISPESFYGWIIPWMTPYACWPRRNPTLFYKYRCLISIAILVVNCLLSWYSIMGGANISTKLVAFMMAPLFAQYTFKQIIMSYKNEEYCDIFDKMHHPIFQSHEPRFDYLVKEQIRLTDLFGRIFVYNGITYLIFVSFHPILEFDEFRPLPYYLPFEIIYTNVLAYIGFYAFQCIGFNMIVLNNPPMDVMICCFMSFVTAQLRILNKKVQEVTDMIPVTGHFQDGEFYEKYDEPVLEKLKDCVVHHLHIIELSDAIEEAISFILLSTVVFITLLQCTLEFSIILSPLGRNTVIILFLLIAAFLQPVVYGFFGEQMIQYSYELANNCYASRWIYCGPRARKYLALIMTRSRRPLCVTVGKFSIVSLQFITTIFKTAFSYSLFLRRFF